MRPICALRRTFEKLFTGVERNLRHAPNFNRAISMICAVRWSLWNRPQVEYKNKLKCCIQELVIFQRILWGPEFLPLKKWKLLKSVHFGIQIFECSVFMGRAVGWKWSQIVYSRLISPAFKWKIQDGCQKHHPRLYKLRYYSIYLNTRHFIIWYSSHKSDHSNSRLNSLVFRCQLNTGQTGQVFQQLLKTGLKLHK